MRIMSSPKTLKENNPVAPNGCIRLAFPARSAEGISQVLGASGRQIDPDPAVAITLLCCDSLLAIFRKNKQPFILAHYPARGSQNVHPAELMLHPP
ncbi:hypothetical protein M1E17_09630 [Arthrobacter sp. D1-29]